MSDNTSKFGAANFRPLHVRDVLLFERGNVKGFATQGGETGVNSPIGANSNPGAYPDTPFVIGVYSCFGEATQPGNLRAIDSELLFHFAGETTIGGSIAAIRGGACVASGCELSGTSFLYGVQGKLIIQGELDTSAGWQTAVFGQLDFSSATATLTSQNLSAGWFDMGASAGALATNGTGVDVLRLTNSTALIVNSLVYASGIATYFAQISDVDGTHFAKTAGTPTTSAGQLKVLVNGVVRYIQLFSTTA